MANYVQKGAHFCFDNFFTSVSLLEEMLSRGFTCLGTLRPNKREIIEEHKVDKYRPLNSVFFTFNGQLTLLSVAYKPTKYVYFLSSFHHKRTICDKSFKAEMNEDYNYQKYLVDSVDQKCLIVNTKNATRRWPVRLFQNNLDLIGINSHVLFEIKHNISISRKYFLQSIAYELILPQLKLRRYQLHPDLNIKRESFFKDYLIRNKKGVKVSGIKCEVDFINFQFKNEHGIYSLDKGSSYFYAEQNSNTNSKVSNRKPRSRCHLCNRLNNVRRDVSTKCSKCRKFTCSSHLFNYKDFCMDHCDLI